MTCLKRDLFDFGHLEPEAAECSNRVRALAFELLRNVDLFRSLVFIPRGSMSCVKYNDSVRVICANWMLDLL